MSKKILGLILLLMFVGLFGFVFRIAVYPLFVAEKVVDTGYELTDKTFNADNVISNYEWFKTQYEAINAQKEKANQSEIEYETFSEKLNSDSSKWTKFQEREEASLRNSLSANKKILADLIAEYNARAKMVNRSIFKGELPDEIDLTDF